MPFSVLRPYRFWLLALVGLVASSLVASCFGVGSLPSIDSTDQAREVLTQQVIPSIQVEDDIVSDAAAARYTTDPVAEPLPAVEDFPLYGANPGAGAVYIEIFSSSEKANVERQNERWLVEVADTFNQQQNTLPTGEVIQVGIRKIASGTAARLLNADAAQPNGYSPSNDLWISLIQSEGVPVVPVAERLVPNMAGWVVPQPVYDALAANATNGEVTFDQLLNGVASGDIAVAYPNPYASSTALNLLYTLYWRAAGHQDSGGTLTAAELQTPQVNSVFEQFQSQVLITTPTTLDLQELFLRDQSTLQAFPLEYQNYQALRQVPGFENTAYIPFGIPHNNPLVGFEWNTPQQAAALEQFAAFAQSAEMQALAAQQGFVETDYLTSAALPPVPEGEVLLAAQSNWKLRKDGGRTVYMALVIDTSGSMDGEPLEAVQAGLRVAADQINPGNFVSIVTFDDSPVRRLPLAPFDPLQHQKFLATVDQLQADGATAMYDGVLVALGELMEQQARDPTGRFFLLLLTDGKANRGYTFGTIEQVMAYSDVRFYPIAYGDVDQAELEAIAELRESAVQEGNPNNVRTLFKDLFQINL